MASFFTPSCPLRPSAPMTCRKPRAQHHGPSLTLNLGHARAAALRLVARRPAPRPGWDMVRCRPPPCALPPIPQASHSATRHAGKRRGHTRGGTDQGPKHGKERVFARLGLPAQHVHNVAHNLEQQFLHLGVLHILHRITHISPSALDARHALPSAGTRRPHANTHAPCAHTHAGNAGSTPRQPRCP